MAAMGGGTCLQYPDLDIVLEGPRGHCGDQRQHGSPRRRRCVRAYFPIMDGSRSQIRIEATSTVPW